MSEPESPSNIRKFSYPVIALCWFRGNQRAECLQVLFDPVSLILVKYKQLRDEFPSHGFDAWQSYSKASFIRSDWEITILGDPDAPNRIDVCNGRTRPIR